MDQSRRANFKIGFIALLTAVLFVLYANGMFTFSSKQPSEFYAVFRQVTGMKVGSEVRLAGFRIGTVRSIKLNPSDFQVKIGFIISENIVLPIDSNARILTDGLGGKAYIDIQPGAEDRTLQPGNFILYTQGSVDILDLLAKAILSSDELAKIRGQ